jgi:hypothetical protein
MAFTGNYMPTSFKQEILEGVHDFRAVADGGDSFYIALYMIVRRLSLLPRPAIRLRMK